MIEAAIVCLALNLYHEARGEPVIGQIAVSQVVLNRVKDKRYPNTVCGVVRQARYSKTSKLPLRHQCQFSWFCDGKSDKPRDKRAFKWSYDLSKRVLLGEFSDLVGGATHYHSVKVNPNWAIKKKRVTKIGDHIFHKWTMDNGTEKTKNSPTKKEITKKETVKTVKHEEKIGTEIRVERYEEKKERSGCIKNADGVICWLMRRIVSRIL